ncbi:MAG: DUF3040 domain-containing protein [Propionibacteriaceae bacterium]|nr:DUF3040 domain-containing protein [Propionibacteriaceae bacterium]
MALSADEQRLLDQLEASLRAEDPGLARKFEVKPEPAPVRRPWWALAISIPVGIVLLALGMFWVWPLSVFGFLVMFGGVIFVAARSGHKPADQPAETEETEDSGWSPW